MVIRMLGLVNLGKGGRSAFRVDEDDTLPPRDGSVESPDDMEMGMDDEGAEMEPKAALLQINKQSAEIYNLLQNDRDFEEWVNEKLTQAAKLVNTIHGHITYEVRKPDALPQGTETVMAQTRNY